MFLSAWNRLANLSTIIQQITRSGRFFTFVFFPTHCWVAAIRQTPIELKTVVKNIPNIRLLIGYIKFGFMLSI